MEEYYQQIKVAIKEADMKKFNEVMEKRMEYIKNMSDEEKVHLKEYIEKDKELFNELKENREQIKRMVLSQQSKKRAVEKYNQF